jgi:cbb3-type cytochrome oxidase subunit 3
MNPQSPAGCVLMLVVPALLVVSTYLAWWELRFLVQGQTADAVVNGVEAIKLTRHRMFVGPYLEIRYSFHDERSGELRTEHDELPLDWPRPVGTVRIEYVPGLPGGSRVEGHRHAWFTILFVVCLIGSGVYVGFLLRDARRAVSEEEAFEARRRRRHED